MDEQLLSYVRAQRQNGYSDKQIAEALRGQKYPESLIKNLLASAEPVQAHPGLLKTYVETYRQQGYSEDQIRSSLATQGFEERDVTRALHRRPRHKVTGLLFLFPLLALGLLLGVLFLLFQEPEQPPVPIQTDARLSDIIDTLLPLADKDAEAARSLCDAVVESDRQRCILAVGRESSNPGLCAEIVDNRLRDACYLDFIYDGHYEYCPRLTLPSNIEYCQAVNA